MSEDTRRDRAGWEAHEGASAHPGRGFEPSRSPEEEAAPDRANPKAAPIGTPFSPEEYRQLKEKAKEGDAAAKERRASSAGSAQEDPSAREG